jgi:hypothetical protein
LTLECDELWSFVGDKQQQVWSWLAIDRDTREIVGGALGNRDQATAQEVWQSLPAVYTANVRSITPISGTHMPPCFQPSAIAQWEKRRGKPATLSEKTTHCGSVRRVWCEKHAHFRKNLLTMSVQFGIAFII